MDRNRIIIGAGLIVGLTGSIVAIQENRSVMKAVGGAAAMTILLGLLAAAGEGPAKVASGLAALAAASILMYEAVPLLGFVNSLSGAGNSYSEHSSERATTREGQDR